MRRSVWKVLPIWGLVLGLALGAGAGVAAAAGGENVDALVARNNEAQGGRKLREVRSARMTGTLQVEGEEQSHPLRLEFVPPRQKVRLDITTKGAIDTTAYDGAVGWSLQRSDGKTESQRLTGEALKEIKATADFQGPLFDAGAKGNKVEYLGKATIDGTPAFKLRLTTTEGDETTVFLDAHSYLDIREESTRGGANNVTEKVSTFGGWKTIGGITLPTVLATKETTSIAGGSIRSSGSLRIEISQIEFDVEIPADRFARPKGDTVAP